MSRYLQPNEFLILLNQSHQKNHSFWWIKQTLNNSESSAQLSRDGSSPLGLCAQPCNKITDFSGAFWKII